MIISLAEIKARIGISDLSEKSEMMKVEQDKAKHQRKIKVCLFKES